MIIEVWVVITGKGDRPFCHARRPARELLEKWHREEGGVRVLHLTANVADAGHDPKRAWATVFEEPTPADPDWELVEHFGVDAEDSLRLLELRQAIDAHLGWPDAESEERGDYLARIVELGRALHPHSTHGRESAEDYPNLTHCPCCGTDKQVECAAAGCGYCTSAERMHEGPKRAEPEA